MALEQALQVCGDLGVPISEEKLEGPDKVITFLGIEIDSEMLQLRLPEVKLQRASCRQFVHEKKEEST